MAYLAQSIQEQRFGPKDKSTLLDLKGTHFRFLVYFAHFILLVRALRAMLSNAALSNQVPPPTPAFGFAWKGQQYLLSHPKLWAVGVCYILLAALIGVVALIILMAAALEPQAETFGGGEFGWIMGVLVVLVGEFR